VRDASELRPLITPSITCAKYRSQTLIVVMFTVSSSPLGSRLGTGLTRPRRQLAALCRWPCHQLGAVHRGRARCASRSRIAETSGPPRDLPHLQPVLEIDL